MLYREIGQSKIQASVVALGAWAIGGGPWWGQNDENDSIRTIHESLDGGINLIDTAPAYGFGLSESVVGKAIRDRRDKVVLSTKCGLWWNDTRGAAFFEMEGKTVRRSLDPETIRIEIESSLQRLGTDYIDVYHTHWQSVQPYYTPIAETMECLMQLKKQGKIRAVAVSNCDPMQMAEYEQTGKIDANQPKYSLLDRNIEQDGIVDYCVDNNISILAYSPLEQGLLTGKIGMDAVFTDTEYRNNISWMKPNNRQKVLDMLRSFTPLTEKYRCTMAQLVIAWTFSQRGISHVLCGARKPHNVRENLAAGDLVLDESDIQTIREAALSLGNAE